MSATYPLDIVECIRRKYNEVNAWLSDQEQHCALPLYLSADIRDSGFKRAVVDTNLFPAGFNNLCEHGIADAVVALRRAIQKRVPQGKEVLIISEEHTRNTWYLENVRILEDIIHQAGYRVRIATFLEDQPDFCRNGHSIHLDTATGHRVQIHCFQNILANYKEGKDRFDLIILNNDLTTGIPDVLRQSGIPIYPSLMAGWHSRLKTHHFRIANQFIRELSAVIGIDPWFLLCYGEAVGPLDIYDREDRERVADQASLLLRRIQIKYNEYGILEKPYIFLKDDAGTYGMGVMAIEDPSEIINLNRKKKDRLAKRKGSKPVDHLLLQEGVPTIQRFGQQVSEACIYQVENTLVGGFFRTHASKGDRDSLNSRGMDFEKMCPHLKEYADCGVDHDMNLFDVFRILARVAGIASHHEIVMIEEQKAIDVPV